MTRRPTNQNQAEDTRPHAATGDDDSTTATALVRGEPPAEPRTDEGGLADALRAVELALDKKALDPVLLDVRALCSYCNYQLVVSGRSDRQVDAIAGAIAAGLREGGVRSLGTEGKGSGQWALLDFGDVVVHVFHHPVREHYDLESLWIDAPRVELDIPPEARVGADDY